MLTQLLHTMAPEAVLLLIVLIVNAFAYIVVYPLKCGGNLKTMTLWDIAMTCAALALASVFFAGKSVDFSLLRLIDVNWFIATIVYYSAIDFILFWVYTRTYTVTFPHAPTKK